MRLGKTDRSISDIENGKTNPKLDTVSQTAIALNIGVDAAIGITPEGGVPLRVKQLFAGMTAEEASKVRMRGKFETVSKPKNEACKRLYNA